MKHKKVMIVVPCLMPTTCLPTSLKLFNWGYFLNKIDVIGFGCGLRWVWSSRKIEGDVPLKTPTPLTREGLFITDS
jgi:hypothetical protein